MVYKSEKNRGKWQKTLIGALLIFSLFAGLSAAAVHKVYRDNLKPVSGSQRSQTITIPVGSSVREIAEILQDAGLIKQAWAFEWFVRNNNVRDKLLAGTYAIKPNMTVQEIVNILTQGKIETNLVTIIPGQRIDQIRQSMVSQYGFNQNDVNNALDPAQYENHPALVDKPRNASLEGYLYPESFQKTAETKPETIIRASLDEMQKQLTPSLRAGIVKQGLTVHEGVILASIIEQEVSDPEDMAKVAQVFLKRLREDIALESDPTAIYGAVLAGVDSPSITYDSSYNTYNNKGLTPTPVSNVTDKSLNAVANPAGTKYLYFVAGDDGKTHFSSTLAEHEALTEKYCTKLCR